jgi:hypothetical protein
LIALFAMVACLHMQLAEGAPTGAVLGIDLGSDNCVVAIARRKGVDIVTNEASARSTPTIVSVSNPCCHPTSMYNVPLVAALHWHLDHIMPTQHHVPLRDGGHHAAPQSCHTHAHGNSAHCGPRQPPLSRRLRTETYPPLSTHTTRRGDEMGEEMGVPKKKVCCWADALCFLQFGQTQRFIGEAGSTQRMSNLKNTIVRLPLHPISVDCQSSSRFRPTDWLID